MPDSLFGVGKWQKIVCKATADRSPAQMIGNPNRSEATNQRLQFREIILSQRIGSSDIERDAMKDDRRELPGFFEYLKGPTARNHEVFRDYFKPVGAGSPVQDMRIVNSPKADAVPKMG